MAGYYDRDRNFRVGSTGAHSGTGVPNAAGTMGQPIAHYGNTSEFLVSGWPFIANVAHSQTGAEVDFEHVTQFIVVTAGETTTIYFADIATYTTAPGFVIPAGTTSPRIDVKCGKIWVTTGAGSATTTILAGLTNVPNSELPSMVTWPGAGVP
tara:strand:+ start:1875 stop:2333 length:459 start_codon:yes stop_codon:yes gene_type:complete